MAPGLSLEQDLSVPIPSEVFELSICESGVLRSVALDRELTSLGRSSTQDVVLQDARVSRRHAILVRTPGAYEVVDQGSTHGTFLNGSRVERAFLTSRDLLQLGSQHGPELWLRVRRAADSTDDTVAPRPGSSSSLTRFVTPSDASPPAERFQQLSFLINAARQLNESGGADDILRGLLTLTLQLTGVERGFVFLAGESGLRLGLGLRADGTALVEDETVSRRVLQKAVESRANFTISDTLAEQGAAEWTSLIRNDIRRIYCIPLHTRAASANARELLGVLYLDSRIGPGTLSEIDRNLLETLAAESAGILHNALLAEAEHTARQAREELVVAATIHTGLMSLALPKPAFAKLEAKTVPCLSIGGDFYDALVLDDMLYVTVADVSGKGVSAAIVAATLQGLIHAQMLARQPLPQIATIANQFLCARSVGKYATLVMLRLCADGRLEYLNCGHVQPVSVLDGAVRSLPEANLAVGLLPAAQYESSFCTLQRGERILVASDGITEAENEREEAFGDTRLFRIAPHCCVEEILAHVQQFQHPHTAADDCTLLELRFEGEPSSSLIDLVQGRV